MEILPLATKLFKKIKLQLMQESLPILELNSCYSTADKWLTLVEELLRLIKQKPLYTTQQLKLHQQSSLNIGE